jgi:hypothetical protein
MDERVFIDHAAHPSEDQLKVILDATYEHFRKLRDLTGQLNHEWRYFSRKSGWVFKVHHHDKALFYLTPLTNKFQIGMTLTDAEKKALLDSVIDDRKKYEIKAATKYPEGYPLRFMVETENELDQVVTVLNILNKI